MKHQKTTNTLKKKLTSLNPTSSILNSVNENKQLRERLLEATDKQHQEMSRAIKLKEINLILKSRLHGAVVENSQLREFNVSRNRSRSPHRSPAQFKDKSKYDDSDVLHLQNIPKDWRHGDVRKFLTEVAKVPKHVQNGISYIWILKDENDMPKGECLLIMPNSNLCRTTCEQLAGFSFEGKQIYVMLDKESSFPSRGLNKKLKQPKNMNPIPKPNFQPPTDINNPNIYETYGLSTSFLNSLGIKPPLLNTIFIANLDAKVDEAKLREVFSHAGQVLNVILIKKNPKKIIAKVEYDHPVEAVQAISMLHNQDLYNRKLIVQLDQSPRSNKFLPEGLSGFGPGLGDKGEPLRGVRNALDLQPFKQFLTQEVDKLKSKEQKDIPNTDNPNLALPINMPFVNPFTNFNNPSMMSSNNLMTSLNSLLNNQGMQNYQALQNLLQQNIGNDMLSLAAFSQNPAQNIIGFNANVAGNQPPQVSRPQSNKMSKIENAPKSDNFGIHYTNEQSFHDSRGNYDRGQVHDNIRNTSREDYYREPAEESGRSTMTTTDMLVFTNLPSSVTLQALKAKMQEVGELKFAEMTSQGRAIVRFANVEDASRCVQLFDRSKVDGQTIDVNFF